ncbi:hypothetical protein KQI65_15695 [bacterium]|nr:hypothetical protein [bacterium]
MSSTSGLSSKSTAELHYRAGYRAEFGEHPLFQVMNFEQTLPPEAMRQLGLGSTEDLLSVEDPVFPYVLTRDSTESVPQSGLHMAFDQVLIRTDSYVGGHTLLSLEYDWWPALLQHGSLGIGGAVSAGVGYNGTLTLESLAAARMGSFHLAGGLRFMHFPFPLVDEESTFRESQFSTHYTTTSELQENRPADIRGDLYSSFGIGFRMQRVQLRVQLLRQIAPSVHIESHRSGNQYPPTDPYGSITDGIRLTAISISAGIIF